MTTVTVGKDAGSALLNLTASRGGKSAAATDSFQKIWSGQMNKDSIGSTVQDNAASTKGNQTEAGKQVSRGDSLKAKDVRATQGTSQKVKEMSPEELEQAGEVMGQAAMEMMQQIADVFGISVEEVQAAMEELGLEETGILEVSGMNSLLLKLGGAEDSYALITDGELYDNYRMVMDELSSTLQECADELGVEPGKLLQLLEESLGKGTVEDAVLAEEPVPVETVAGKTEHVETEADELVLTGESVTSVDAVQETVQKEQAQNQTGGETNGGEKSHGDRESRKERSDVVFGQEFRTEQYQPGTQQTQAIPQSGGWDADTRDIMNQIMDYMKLRLNGDTSNLEMQLHPASLGTLQIQIASKGGVVTANFITQNEAVKSALESQMVELRERFEEQGVKIEAIEVTVQTHEFERNLEQGRGREQQEPERRSRTRRIRFGDSLSIDNMGEEEASGTQSLGAEGSTVNYMA